LTLSGRHVILTPAKEWKELDDEEEAIMIRKVSVEEAGPLASAERGFTFPLPTQVDGVNARGQDFSEGTILTYINHQGSSFYLKNPVHIGTRLRLVVDLPEKLSEDRTLKLVIKGKVALIEALREHGPGQKVTVHFDSKYIIKPDD
jgi:hypothetical protein